METSRPSNGGGGINIGEGLVAAAALGIAFLIFLLIVYSIVLGLSAGAIYLGAMLGSNGQIGKKSLHIKAKEKELEKQEHLNALADESEEMKELVAGKFENEKMNLYRDDGERPEPLINVNLDA